MRRSIMMTICLLTLASLVTVIVRADSPKYHSADPSFDSKTACYSVKLTETGLGNSGFSSITYDLSCTAAFTTVCVNKGGNTVSGQPKSGTGTATEPTILPIRNGSTTGTVTLCPGSFTLPDPGCTGGQKEEITAAQYSACSLSDGLGTPSPSLPALGGSNLSVIVP